MAGPLQKVVTGTPWITAVNVALGILAFVNLFNYLDRYLVSALVESLKHSALALSDTQAGSLMSGFLIVFAVIAPVFGSLGDRLSRPRLIAFGVACWSLATALSGLAWNFASLFAARALVGIGEAAYVTIGPSLLSDYFPRGQRGRVMAIFFCAIPVGSALGYIVGGLMDVHFGWRMAFFVAGIPGLALALLCLNLPDPPRGSQEGDVAEAALVREPSGRRRALHGYGQLLRNKPYVLTVLGYVAYTFALGGLAFWMPAFLERMRGIPREQATVSFGTIVVITGFLGTFAGGWLGDYCAKYSERAYLWISAAATLLAAPFAWIALTAASPTVYLACMVMAQLLMFLSTGPINASIVNLVLPTQRASANALGVFTIHVLGDVPSPIIIGMLSDASSLSQAVKIVPLAILASAAIWAIAALSQRKDRTA